MVTIIMQKTGRKPLKDRMRSQRIFSLVKTEISELVFPIVYTVRGDKA